MTPEEIEKARQYLRARREAAARVRAEKLKWLLSLSPEESWRIYVMLVQARSGPVPSSPSPLLWAMRRAVAKLAERSGP